MGYGVYASWIQQPKSTARRAASRNASALENVATRSCLDTEPSGFPVSPGARRIRQRLDLPGGDHRQQADEEQKTREEETEAADERTDLNPRRGVHHPARGQIAPMERRDDDDEPLEPHA